MTHSRATHASRKHALLPGVDGDDPRSMRALTERMAVRRLPDGRYAVEGESDATYVVDLDATRCTCPDHEIRGERCKHLRRVDYEVALGRLPPPDAPERSCALCRTSLGTDASGEPPLCADCRPSPGEVVSDRESGAGLLVLRATGRRADEVEIPDLGWTVADHPTNRGYDPRDPVVEAVYVEDVTAGKSPRVYAFPAGRLARRQEPSGARRAEA